MSALGGAVLALILFVVTQSILKFFIEPILEQRRLIGEVAHALSIYAYIQDIKMEGVEETERNLRSLSARLWGSLWSIPLYDVFALVGLVPKRGDVMAAATGLRVWSYSLTSPDGTQRRGEIAERLGI